MNNRPLEKLILPSLLAAMLSGCGGAVPTPETRDANATVKADVDRDLAKEAAKKHCSDYNELKKAVAILINKIEASEKRINAVEAVGRNGADGADGLSGGNGLNGANFVGVPADTNNNDRKDIERLRAEMAELKRQLDALPKISKDSTDDFTIDKQVVEKYCRNINVVSIDPSRSYRAKADLWVRPCPTKTSKPLRLMKKGTVVKYRGCDIYGWCELSDGSGFVAGYMFKRIKITKKRK